MSNGSGDAALADITRRFFFAEKISSASGSKSGAIDDLGEHVAEGGRHLGGDGAIRSDDAAEGTHRIACVGADVGLGDVVGDGDAARIGVLDHDAGRVVEPMDEPPRGLGVEHVEVAEFLAAVLRHRVPPAGGPGLAVSGTLLMRVLAVSQRLRQFEGEVDRRRQAGHGRRSRRPSVVSSNHVTIAAS